MRAVVALGGNAILPRGGRGTVGEQRRTIEQATTMLAALDARGISLVVTHGNGPQIGRLLIQGIAAERRTPPMPLDVLGAQSQAQVGYLLQQSLANALHPKPVVTLVTQTVVDSADPAFAEPSKPIGPYLLAGAARTLQAHGVPVAHDPIRGGWRRVVASPRPLRIVETPAILALLAVGAVPVCAGGGGVPVVEEPGGSLRGVEAVVDKDLAAAVLCEATQAKLFVILTDVEHVLVARGTESERSIGRMTVAEAKNYLTAGEFPAGSMGPKVEAAIRAVESGARAIITSLEAALDAVDGQAGTEIVA